MSARYLFFLVLSAVLLAVAGPAGGEDKPATPADELPRDWRKLGLTNQQVEDVAKVRAGNRAKVEELQRQIAKLQDQEQADMEKVLTEPQRKRLKELRKQEK